jgi:hypothetical protein
MRAEKLLIIDKERSTRGSSTSRVQSHLTRLPSSQGLTAIMETAAFTQNTIMLYSSLLSHHYHFY